MNTAHTPPYELPADRFALRITARLTEGASELPYDISERLRAGRMQALARRKKAVAVVHTAPVLVHTGHSATLGGGGGMVAVAPVGCSHHGVAGRPGGDQSGSGRSRNHGSG